jgi:predicted AlkP superfamily phosphohydrolase/phosphomutase
VAGDVILLEFNELSPVLMDRFIGQGMLPNFARLRASSLVAVTDAEEPPPALEPWIQWVTVHTGLSYAEHGIFDLDDGYKLTAPRIWDLVSEAGNPVWVCGSMNGGFRGPSLNGCLLPDPWSTGAQPYPAGMFDPYVHVVRSYVQEYTRDKVPLTKADLLRFGAFMARHGLSAKTVTDTLRQLASERGVNRRWRRAAILDRLQWDLFRSVYRKLNPKLSTFFLNSTAHYQHYYWRNMEPECFAVRPTEEEQARFADAIPFGYRKMDEIVGECLRLAGPDTTIVLATALSQQPLLRYEDMGGKQIFRPHDAQKLGRFAGIEASFMFAPVMAEQFHLNFDSEAAAEEAVTKLQALRLRDGQKVMEARPGDAEIWSAASNATAPFAHLFYKIDGVKSGQHHPDGILWISRPDRKRRQVRRKVSLREMAPTLLHLCGLPPSPAHKLPAMPELAAIAAPPELEAA